ncbi:3-oxoadipate enol-lactonase [Rhodococcoides corynebacterioides]|uniref:3-oxoadipate enol-lactonase n=1 Tax=Rhodococcoides corynebacterioides TaxID=53972 RepID=A0ABS7P864_9NOCA|nr:3-oxoadipate enol-lactonase [Rhodococcus corynebacterioides]MBY6368231.1 3-oxoadipate enol-lactonase [Rhodococcus corynebacterioides]MBY6409204.1 3-oxoadipate enol-lactonase [Rhodococcus corynebacterioides]
MTVPLAHDLTPAPRPDAPTVVLLGSLGSDRSMWDAQVAALADVASVLTVDVRGHGGSPVTDTDTDTGAPDGVTVDHLAADVTALLDDLGLGRVRVVGLSLGGAVAQTLAAQHPDRIASLTVLCSAARFGEPDAWTTRADTVRRDGVASIAGSIVERWFTAEYAAAHPDVVDRCVAMVSAVPDEGYAVCCEALSRFDSRPLLGTITAPTLVIAGDRDPATPPESLAVIADGIAGARLEVLSPAAHLAAIERAAEVSALVRAHVTAHS